MIPKVSEILQFQIWLPRLEKNNEVLDLNIASKMKVLEFKKIRLW